MIRAIVFIALTSLLGACGSGAARSSARSPEPTTVNGEILGVDRVPPEQTLAQSIRITVSSGSRPIIVELAPGWYLDEHGLRFEREQLVEVQGTLDPNSNVLVARRVRKGGSSLELRDEQGTPLWQGREPEPVSAPPEAP